ncbi:MAG: hypothetical protein ISP64_06545 [Flavobacteriaceae bacterium]|nr:hypothetical protein [Flavobacteriaceae bacterium]
MKKYLVKYSLEFLVIVLGISISFWLNQITVEGEIKQQRSRLLENLLLEVEEIEKYCADRLKIWNQDVEIYSKLLEENLDLEAIEGSAISKSRVEYNLIYYRDFSPPINRYISAVNTGDLKYIKSQEIIDALTRLHNQNFNMVQSTVEYEKSLKTKLISLLTSNYPKIIINGEDNNVSMENYLEYLHKIIRKDEHIRSELLVQMRYFKTRVSFLKFYLITLDELKFALNEELNIN